MYLDHILPKSYHALLPESFLGENEDAENTEGAAGRS